jgi:hypothetical protein
MPELKNELAYKSFKHKIQPKWGRKSWKYTLLNTSPNNWNII